MKRYNKQICRMCSIFNPISARAGICTETGEEKLAYKACTERESFELHPKGRGRNLRGEVAKKNALVGDDDSKEAKSGTDSGKEKPSGGNAETEKGRSGVQGQGTGAGKDKVSEKKGDSSGSARKKVSKPTGKRSKKE